MRSSRPRRRDGKRAVGATATPPMSGVHAAVRLRGVGMGHGAGATPLEVHTCREATRARVRACDVQLCDDATHNERRV